MLFRSNNGNAMHDPTNLKLRRPEIDQQANLVTRRLQIIQTLCPMGLVQRGDGLEFDDNRALDNQIAKKSPTTTPS